VPDACAQSCRRLDLGSGAAGERDCSLLLGKQIRELGRRCDARIELGAPLGRQGSVGERRNLRLISLVAPHRHGDRNGNARRAAMRAGWSGLPGKPLRARGECGVPTFRMTPTAPDYSSAGNRE